MIKLKGEFWNKRRVRALVGLGVILWVAITYSISPYSYGRFLWPYGQVIYLRNVTENVAEAPPIKYSTNITLTTVSDYSVGVQNPIHAVVIVYDVNRTDFGNFYYAVVFEYSGFSWNVPPTSLPPQATNVGLLSQLENGVWKTETDIVFFHEWINFTGPILVPTYYAGRTVSGLIMNQQMAPQIKALNISITLQPQSFSDQLLMHETDAKYGAMGSSISLVFLSTIFEGIAISKKEQKKPTKKEGKSDKTKVKTKGQGKKNSDRQTHDKEDTRQNRQHDAD
ncbi:MAG: hypothetical protein WB643_03770 [Candidatus Bathyarchaeia archaeon]